jgi:hypothetical protein
MVELVLGFRVANLWPEFPAHDVYWTVANGKECKKPSKSMVAAAIMLRKVKEKITCESGLIVFCAANCAKRL